MNRIWRRPQRKTTVFTLPLATLPWVTATAAVTIAPHYANMPPWLGLSVLLALLGRLWYSRQGRLTPPRYLTFLMLITGLAGILIEYRTLLGKEPGVALLAVLMALKLFELRTQRDAIVVVMLGYFLLLTHYFYADDITVGLWMLAALIITTGTLIRLQTASASPPRDILQLAGQMILQAMPIMVILFVLFPRIPGPLWGLPLDRRPTTGLSDEMSPGSISQLSQSSALAFRVAFQSPPPARDKLYWRGPVMTEFDGKVWRVARNLPSSDSRGVPSSSGQGARTDYSVTLEPHQQRWLLALDMPVQAPANSSMNNTFSLLNHGPVRERYRYAVSSNIDYRVGTGESAAVLQASLALPPQLNPRARTLAKRLTEDSRSPRETAERALQMFREEPFVYTLSPPLLGENAIDDFLFGSRRGFCEHYAAAFVFLMRAAGIPARVIGGYQGGEINPIDNHLTVRQSDAHAWAEIWVTDDGWIRVDPTAAIAPSRIEEGLQASLPQDESLPALMRLDMGWMRAVRHRWDALNNGWNQWVLGYNNDRQKQFLQRFGLSADWRNLVSLLALIGGTVMLATAVWILRGRRQQDPAQRLWVHACNRFARQGITRLPWEGPETFLTRVAAARPDLAPVARSLAELYIPLRYGVARDNSLSEFRRLVRRIPDRWSFF